MTKFALLLPTFALLAACGGEPAPAPTETAAAVSTPEPVNSLPAPDQPLFAKLFGEACPSAEPVSTAVCKRAAFGSTDVVCEYGLGKDNYLRNKATLTPNTDGTDWMLADAANVCAPEAKQTQG